MVSIRADVDSMGEGIDVLNSMQLVEDFFWINPEDITVQGRECFDEFQVGANETVNFSANMSTDSGPSPTGAQMWVYLTKNGQEIATSSDDRGLTTPEI